MTDVDVAVERVYPATATDSQGRKLGYLPATSKAAQNDTITITNANTVVDADLRVVATGAAEPYTISANVITLTSATTGSVRGQIYYK